MKTDRADTSRDRPGHRDCAGTILIETLVALVLLAIAIGPLITTLLAAQARAAEVRSSTATPELADAAADDAWSWGPAVATAKWLPGPKLEVQAALPGDCTLGLWLNGWFVDEEVFGGEGSLVIGSQTFPSSVQGAEVTLRVRRSDGGWGPPWRSLVPDLSGVLTAERTLQAPAVAKNAPTGEACTVLHPPAAANPGFQVSGESGAEVGLDGSGLPRFLCAPPSVQQCVRLGSDTQAWQAEEGGALDVYF